MNLRHEQFAIEYVNCNYNGAKAYGIVYGNVKPATAKNNASRLLANADVQARIHELASRINNRLEAKATRSRAELVGDTHRVQLKAQRDNDIKPLESRSYDVELRAIDQQAKLLHMYRDEDTGNDQFERVIALCQVNIDARSYGKGNEDKELAPKQQVIEAEVKDMGDGS